MTFEPYVDRSPTSIHDTAVAQAGCMRGRRVARAPPSAPCTERKKAPAAPKRPVKITIKNIIQDKNIEAYKIKLMNTTTDVFKRIRRVNLTGGIEVMYSEFDRIDYPYQVDEAFLYNDKLWNIDSGFIVYNERTYPNFIKILDQLGVNRQLTRMGFSVKSEKHNQ